MASLNISNAPVTQDMYDENDNMVSVWSSWFRAVGALLLGGVTTTQTFKDGTGTTHTMTIVNGVITKIV
jgi:hypothetical protein